MTANSGYSGSTGRCLAVLCAVAMMMAVSPQGTASAQEPAEPDRPDDACPVEPDQAGFADRDAISDAHVGNVDCAASLNVVAGFEDTTYRPRLAVRRDQMASFIAQGLDAAGVELPAGTDDQFTDVTAGPHRVNVNRLAEAGIVQGGPQDLALHQYGPGLATRRDQMASFLMRAAGYALFDDPHAFADRFAAPAGQAFNDVPSGNSHFGNVNAAADTGLARGFAGGFYQPAQETTRDQMASFVVRLLNFLAVPTTVRITDQTAETVTVGRIITVVATVFDQYDNPAAETTTVTFSADTTPPETASELTDPDGRANFTFTSTEPGIVTVTAAIEGPGGRFVADGDSDSVDTEFTAEPPDGPTEPTEPGPTEPPEPEDQQTFTASGTFTVPEGVQQVTVAAWGAGGAGGVLFEPRGGGGGGSYCANTLAVAPGSQYTVTVGAGATPAQGDGQFSAVVGPGGVTVVGARGGGVGTQTGGVGGTTEDCPEGATGHPGGNGGNPAVGVARGGGGGGGSATAMGAGGDGHPGEGAIGGAGGDGEGAGGRGGDVESPGQSGIAPGGGGGGSGEGSTRSGSGANGQVVISWGDGG